MCFKGLHLILKTGFLNSLNDIKTALECKYEINSKAVPTSIQSTLPQKLMPMNCTKKHLNSFIKRRNSILKWHHFFLFFVLQFSLAKAYSPTDTLRISLKEAVNQFSQSNLLLLAQQYQVKASQALAMQAKLLPNPSFSIEQNIVNQSKKEWFPMGSNGQTAIQVQQLIQLAGKRRKTMAMASTQTEISQFTFQELVRTLNFSLQSNFFELYYQQQSLQIYNEEIRTIESLVSAYQELFKKQNAALKDVVRLQSFLLALTSERNVLEINIARNQGEIRTLIGSRDDRYLQATYDESLIDSVQVSQRGPLYYQQKAEELRADLKIQEANIRMNTLNLKLEKANRIPDLTLGYAYDQAGNYIPSYHALTLGFNLPFFDRNQGRVVAAQNLLEASKLQFKQEQLSLENEVLAAFNESVKMENLFNRFDRTFMNTYTTLMRNVVESYRRGNMSMLEFLDFFDAYKNNVTQMNTVKFNRVQSLNGLNYAVGQAVFQLF